jgi:hypothetical protein
MSNIGVVNQIYDRHARGQTKIGWLEIQLAWAFTPYE